MTKQRGGFNPLAAGAAVATIAGAVGAAAYFALADEKRRKKIQEVFSTVKDDIIARMEELREESHIDYPNSTKRIVGRYSTAAKKKAIRLRK